MKYEAFKWPAYQEFMGEDWFEEESYYDRDVDTYLIPEDRLEEFYEKHPDPEYEVGDKITIKSLDWYNNNKDKWGNIYLDGGNISFVPEMSKYCGEVATIIYVIDYGYYHLDIDEREYEWCNEMFEK